MNYLWAGMILIGIIFGAFNGRMEVITNAALDSSKEAVTLCITMIGIMSFWCGIMEIAAWAVQGTAGGRRKCLCTSCSAEAFQDPGNVRDLSDHRGLG